MFIDTTSGSRYFYNRFTNELTVEENFLQEEPWKFSPLSYFNAFPRLNSFIISLTEQCNLRCTYCCYSGEYKDKSVHSSRSMDFNDIDRIYDFIDRVTDLRPLRIFFYGGEALLEYELIKYAVAQGREKWKESVQFSISTNGTTLTHERIDWIVSNKIELAVSIDGTAPFHDKYRIDATGNGSFGKLYRALSYIKKTYSSYVKSISLIMTVADFSRIIEIAEKWHEDELLRDWAPTMLNSLAPNFEKGVLMADYDEDRTFYTDLLNVYEKHRDWIVLKVFFDFCVAYWNNRPIFRINQDVPMATCLPMNSKLYVDVNLQIAVCEKVKDTNRIGDVIHGIDWDKANQLVKRYYDDRVERCRFCPAIRMCNMCLMAADYNDAEWDILCHNEKVSTRIFMYLYCEMAERGML